MNTKMIEVKNKVVEEYFKVIDDDFEFMEKRNDKIINEYFEAYNDEVNNGF